MWFENTAFYHIYPLGFCGAPYQNDGVTVNRIEKLAKWIPYLKRLNIGAVYFSPVFESDNHGYDTRNFTEIDKRLGTNEDFAELCRQFHESGIRVVLDGVYNHVGRGFWAFKDVLQHRENSRYKDWFYINFDGNNSYNDGLWYEGWEGHFELVKLNLNNPEVRQHIYSAVEMYINEFDIDGLRLDVAYSLPDFFMKELRTFCVDRKPDFFLLGEMIHGDYNRIVNGDMLHSATNYECYKGLYSSFNSLNMFEISYSLNRQFGEESWTLYKGKNLACFADNHDVTRIYSILEDKNHIFPLYTVLFTMPGIPFVYYGSEWGAEGEKKDGDNALRPSFEAPVENEISAHVAKLAGIRTSCSTLGTGSFKNETVTNKQWVFSRKDGNERIIVAINADSSPAEVDIKAGGSAYDLIKEENVVLEGNLRLEPYESRILRLS